MQHLPHRLMRLHPLYITLLQKIVAPLAERRNLLVFIANNDVFVQQIVLNFAQMLLCKNQRYTQEEKMKKRFLNDACVC